ncbi:phenylalanine--tRNA ligase subunit beta [archaeon]|nr:phenylalanine--tRNA ligase subunit beta [archaeon]
MPTITVNRKVLESVIGKKLPDDELKDRISMLGTDLESVDDEEIVVEIFPNRPDMLSEQGFGRALSSFIGVKTGLRDYNVKPSGEKVIVTKGMEKVRPYTVCCLVKNLDLDDEKIREIIQIQEKLHITFCRKRKKAAIGIYPMEKIKLPISFTCKKPEDIVFRPLEWNNEINAKQILEQHPTGIKYKDLVKGLDKYALFHDANDEVLSFTPIINSHKTGKIDDTTKAAFLEVSGFDLHTSEYVLNIMVAALIDMGAEVYSMEVKYPDKTIITPNLSPREMKVDLEYINRWLGIDIDEKRLKELFERMGYSYSKGKAMIPCYRPDVIHPADLAEDIAVAYGYENFTPEIPKKSTTAMEDPFEKFRTKVARLLTGLNMLETSSYHLTNPQVQFDNMNLKKPSTHVKLSHTLSEDYDILRFWMLPNLMKILSENTHHEYPQNIFESGYIFKKDSSVDTGVIEINRLAAVICNPESDYTRIRQVLDYLLTSIGLDYVIKETEHDSFIPGRVGRVSVKGKDVAYIGEISPLVLNNFSIEMPASAFELNLTEIFNILFDDKEDEYVKVGTLNVHKKIVELLPDLFLESTKMKIGKIKSIDDRKKKIISKLGNKKVEDIPEIKKYKEFHQKIWNKDLIPAVELLIKKYLSKGKFPDISPIVNCANLVSLENMKDLGLFDADKIDGEIFLRYSTTDDEYLPYGSTKPQKIKEGVPILQDSKKIFAVIGVKDSIETSVDENTENVLVVSWGSSSDDKKKIKKVFTDLKDLIC